MPPENRTETVGKAQSFEVPPPPPDRDVPPDRLDLGGEESFDDYFEAFGRLVLARQPIVTPRGHKVVFKDDAARHLCFAQDRSHRNRRRGADHREIRDRWRQQEAEFIPWVYLALAYPVEIRENLQEPGNEAHLLCFPGSNPGRPLQRYYASVRPMKDGMREFKTGFPVDQRAWDQARRARSLWGRRTTRY